MPLTKLLRTRVTSPASSIVPDPGQQGLEHQPDLQPGQVVAEAEVRAALAERHVVVGRAGDVEAVGIGEHPLVTVAGGEPHHDLVAGLDLSGRRSSTSRVAVRRKW